MARMRVPHLRVDGVTRSILLAWETQCTLREQDGGRPRHAPAAGADPLKLQFFEAEPEFQARRDGYAVADLTRFHDRDFVSNAYRALLGRDPDPEGGTHYLTQLRTGKMTKVEILGRLRYSSEGRKNAVRIPNLFWLVGYQTICRVPVLGYLIELVGTVLRLPLLLRQLQDLETYTHDQFRATKHHLNHDLMAIQERLNELARQMTLLEEGTGQHVDPMHVDD